MLTRLLVFLCDVSPWMRRALWRWWYSKLARRIRAGSWTFMNYGYAPALTTEPLALKPEDEPDRLCIQLYERVVSAVMLKDADVLEVGSGRGGGASYLTRYHQPRTMTGVDYSRAAVAFCRERHSGAANLTFQTGDAENLPFADQRFDVVVNVESSHCYGNVQQFFREVIRVLRPGGHFVFADLRGAPEMSRLRQCLVGESKWTLIEEEDITAQVAAALELDDMRKRKMINEIVPSPLQPVFEEFAGLAGGQVYCGLRERKLLYHRFVFRRLPVTAGD